MVIRVRRIFGGECDGSVMGVGVGVGIGRRIGIGIGSVKRGTSGFLLG